MELKRIKKINNSIERQIQLRMPESEPKSRYSKYKRIENLPGYANGYVGDEIAAQRRAEIFPSIYGKGAVRPDSYLPDVSSPDYKVPSGGGANWSGAGNIASTAVQFAGAAINSFGNNKSATELIGESGTTSVNNGNWTYQRQNDVNASRQMSQLAKENTGNTLGAMGAGAALGGAIGSIFPGAGTVIGGAIGAVGGLLTGLIGSSSRKRKLQKRLQEAQMRINRTNDFYQAQAQGNWLDQQYSLNHQNTQDDVLYAARHGKNIKRPITWQI